MLNAIYISFSLFKRSEANWVFCEVLETGIFREAFLVYKPNKLIGNYENVDVKQKLALLRKPLHRSCTSIRRVKCSLSD